MADKLEVGMKLHAKYSDGQFYLAIVEVISTSKRRAKAPVKVSFVGYEESAWKAIADLKSKKLPKVAAAKWKAKANANAKKEKELSYSGPEKGIRLQAETDGKYYAAGLATVAEAKANLILHLHHCSATQLPLMLQDLMTGPAGSHLDAILKMLDPESLVQLFRASAVLDKNTSNSALAMAARFAVTCPRLSEAEYVLPIEDWQTISSECLGAASAGLRAWAGSSQWVQRAGGNTHRAGLNVIKECVNFMMKRCLSQELQQRFILSRLLFSSSSSSLTPIGHPQDELFEHHIAALVLTASREIGVLLGHLESIIDDAGCHAIEGKGRVEFGESASVAMTNACARFVMTSGLVLQIDIDELEAEGVDIDETGENPFSFSIRTP
jgi:hypothetical protein